MSSVTVSFQPHSAKGALMIREHFANKVWMMTRQATFVAATKAHKRMALLIRMPKTGKMKLKKGFKLLNARHLSQYGHKVSEMNVTTKGAAHTMKVQNFHVPSAPGEPPANDTGNLVGTMTHVQNQDQNGVVSSSVKTYAPYGKWLEYGTRKMAARPFIRPTKAYIEPIFKEYIISRLRRMNKDGTIT
jgi:HK97 gp10 family phage protein